MLLRWLTDLTFAMNYKLILGGSYVKLVFCPSQGWQGQSTSLQTSFNDRETFFNPIVMRLGC